MRIKDIDAAYLQRIKQNAGALSSDPPHPERRDGESARDFVERIEARHYQMLLARYSGGRG
jgi:hypothetical protein